MYQSFHPEEPPEGTGGFKADNLNYEERIIPEEMCGTKEASDCGNKNSPLGGLFGNMELDDIILLAILFCLFNEQNDDWFLTIILIALLIFK